MNIELLVLKSSRHLKPSTKVIYVHYWDKFFNKTKYFLQVQSVYHHMYFQNKPHYICRFHSMDHMYLQLCLCNHFHPLHCKVCLYIGFMIIKNLDENIFTEKVGKNRLITILLAFLYSKFISKYWQMFFSDNAFELLPVHSIITSLLRCEPQTCQ